MNRKKIEIQRDEKHQGTVLFVIGILVALFFGGGIRTFLSPMQVETFIRKELSERKPKFNVEFAKAQLTLSRGWVPRLGLQLNELKLKSNNLCLNPLNLSVDEVYVPVHVFRFLNGQVRFLHIEFGNIEIVGLDKPKHCFAKKPDVMKDSRLADKALSTDVKPTLPVAKNRFDEFMERFNSFINTRWSKELENTRKWMTGVSADSISFQFGSEYAPAHLVKDFYIDAGSDGEFVKAWFAYSPDPEVVYHQPLHNIQVQLEVDEDLMRISGKSGFKEGQWKFSGEMLLDSNQFQLRSVIKTVPVAEVFQGLSKKGILPNVQGSRPIWLSCQKNLKGSLLNWKNADLEISQCVVSGELGSIQLSKSRVKPFQKPLSYEAFQVRLTRFSLENLLDAFHKKPPFDIFHQLGFVSGEITFSSMNEIQFLGDIEEVSLVFSMNGKKEYQKIKSISGELMFREDRFSGQIHDMKLDEGVFEGQLSLNLDKKFRDGKVQANVSNVNLHPDVLKFLQLDGVSHFELYGQGEVENGNFVSWNGNVGFPELKDKGFLLSKTKFRSSWKNNKWKGILSSERARLDSGHPLFNIMFPLYLEENKFSDHLTLKDIEAEIEVDPKKFRWIRAKAWDGDKEIVFGTEGEFLSNGQLSGEIVVDFPVLKLLRWNIKGTFDKPLISPSLKMLKELAKKKPEMTTPSTIEFASEKFYLPKVFQGSPTERLNKIKNSVIDSAKKMLPQNKQKSKTKENQM